MPVLPMPLLPFFHRLMAALLIAAAAALALPSDVEAQFGGPGTENTTPEEDRDVERQRRYQTCIQLANKEPDTGFEEALSWQRFGGGSPAEHCIAVALINLGQYTEAAKRLETAAVSGDVKPHLRADLLAQAGQAYLLAGMPDGAIQRLSEAIDLAPDTAVLYVDRAQAWAARGDLTSADRDLSTALQLDPRNAEALTLRASARRQLGRTHDAWADANAALNIAPDQPDALLERGILMRVTGNNSGARQDWIRLLQVAPDSEAAQAARRNIEIMDLNPDGAAR